jgi:hypothetical protein
MHVLGARYDRACASRAARRYRARHSGAGRVARPPVRTLVSIPAFDFEELCFDYGDVVLAAIGWGEWERLERSLAEGLACESDAQRSGEQIDEGELDAAVVAFRRSRRLLAGEDYLRWLADRSLTTADVRAHLTRTALRERARGRLGEVLPADPPSHAGLVETIRGEAILSGCLRAWAERLARCAAASRGLSVNGGEPPIPSADPTSDLLAATAACQTSGLTEGAGRDRAPRIATLLAAERAFHDRVVTSQSMEHCLADHRLDWQRFVWQEVAFASEGAAREAALWVREQGLGLGEVGAMAPAVTHIREAYCVDVPELSGLLMGAAVGDMLGPLVVDGGWQLLSLRERTPPAIADAVLRERAGAELVEDALERHLAGRVSWNVEH